MTTEVVTPLLIARRQLGLSQDALAKGISDLGDEVAESAAPRAGLSESHLSRIERGQLRPSAKLTICIWKYFDGALSRDEIMFPEFHAPTKKPSRSAPKKKPAGRATAESVSAHG